MALLLFFQQVRAMRQQKQIQTKLTDFIDLKPEIIAVAVAEPEPKSTLELILERLDRIETMLSGGQVTAVVTMTRPVSGGPPVRSSEPVRTPSAQAKELRELMNIPDDQEFVSTSKEILARLRRRKN